MNQNNTGENMDFKGFVLYAGALFSENFHEILSNGILAANLVYVVYQIYSHHKRHKRENEEEQ